MSVVICIDILQFRNSAVDPIVIADDNCNDDGQKCELLETFTGPEQNQLTLPACREADPETGNDWTIDKKDDDEIDLDEWLNIL